MPQLQSVSRRSPAAHVSRRSPKPYELFEAKLALPSVRAGTVVRPGPVNRLRAGTTQRLVTLVTPAGYGKTTLLSQWAERDERPFAWVSLDEGDDASTVLRYTAAALARVQRIEAAGLDTIADCTASVARLASSFARVSAPIVLVFDDVQLVRSRKTAEVIATLLRHVPEGSTMALAGRALPELPVARLRAAGVLLELGADELALSRREARLLLRSARVELDEDEVAALSERTEGWAAGLHLAGLFLQDGAGRRRSPAEFAGDDRFVSDYFRFEHLLRLSAADVRFLTRTSVLDSMCGPLCDAVLGGGRRGSARKLESLEGSSLFVVPQDRRRVWYRYHRLFRDTLRAELEQREPELVPELNRRAAAWCEANAMPDAARRYAAAAGDLDVVARLIATHALPAYCEGRLLELEGWLESLDDPTVLQRYPAAAALGSWIHALAGRPDDAERWLEAAEHSSSKGALPDRTRSLGAWIALLRAAFCRDGAEQMLADAESALAGLARGSRWRPTALLLRGVARMLLGEDDRADADLAEANREAIGLAATGTRRLALAERCVLATAAGDHTRAGELADELRSLAGEDTRHASATRLELAALARAELRAGRWQQAREEIEAAKGFTSSLTHALPWYSVQTLLELTRADIGLLDTSAADACLSEAESILERRPSLGVLALRTRAVRAELHALREESGRRQAMLTAAELRLLPLLTTRLSFREIGERLHVSRNTVKTQAIAVYRKLGVSSRNDAIDRAAELGLVEAAAQGWSADSDGAAPLK